MFVVDEHILASEMPKEIKIVTDYFHTKGNDAVEIELKNKQKGWTDFMDNLLLKTAHSCNVKNIVFVSHGDTDIDTVFSDTFFQNIIGQLNKMLMHKQQGCIYFPCSKTTRLGLHCLTTKLKQWNMGAVILPISQQK